MDKYRIENVVCYPFRTAILVDNGTIEGQIGERCLDARIGFCNPLGPLGTVGVLLVDLLEVEQACRLLLEVGEHGGKDLAAVVRVSADRGVLAHRPQEVPVGVGFVSPWEELLELQLRKNLLNILDICGIVSGSWYDCVYLSISQGARCRLPKNSDFSRQRLHRRSSTQSPQAALCLL